MSDKGAIHNFVGFTTDVSVLLRELCIVALFCLLFFAPNTFKALLTRIGISKISTPVGDIDVAGAGDTVSALNIGLSDSVERLQQIQGKLNDANGKSDIQSVADYLRSLQQEAVATDAAIKTNIASQQATLAQSSPQSTKVPGWLFAGHVDEKEQHWSGEGAKNIPNTLSPVFTVGEKFGVTSPAYLRSDAPSGSHFGSKVIGVVPTNGQVEVVADPQYSHAIAGGNFVWLKVQPL